jgi:hypothetical protein
VLPVVYQLPFPIFVQDAPLDLLSLPALPQNQQFVSKRFFGIPKISISAINIPQIFSVKL